MVRIEIKDAAVLAAFARIDAGLTDKSDLMNDIGQALAASTKERIERGVTPEGTSFAPRSQATLDIYADQGISPAGGPLRRRDDMRGGIHHEYGPDHAEIGSNAVQAAMMHFGGSKSAFPNIWGDIPARPFIGISEEDRIEVQELVEDWLDDLARE